MSFESTGGGREPRAGEDLLTHIPVNSYPSIYRLYCIFGMVTSELSWVDLILHDPGEFELHCFSYH